MKNYKEILEGKNDYEIYHSSYSNAVTELMKFVKKNKYSISEDDIFSEITTGPGKPRDGETHRMSFILNDLQGYPTRKSISVQIAGLSKSFELNMYFGKVPTAKQRRKSYR